MQVPRLGWNWSYSYRPRAQPQQHQILAMSVTYTSAHSNAGSLTWAESGIEPESSWILVGFVNHWTKMGTLRLGCFLIWMLVLRKWDKFVKVHQSSCSHHVHFFSNYSIFPKSKPKVQDGITCAKVMIPNSDVISNFTRNVILIPDGNFLHQRSICHMDTLHSLPPPTKKKRQSYPNSSNIQQSDSVCISIYWVIYMCAYIIFFLDSFPL